MVQESAERDRLVPVYVYERYLGAVNRFIGELDAAEKRGVTLSENEPTPVATEEATAGGESSKYSKGPLTQDEIARLKREFGNQSFHTLMDTLADGVAGSISFPDLMAATGRSRGELNGDLMKLTYFIRREFGKDVWPMKIDWMPGGRALYSLDPEVARWWKEA